VKCLAKEKVVGMKRNIYSVTWEVSESNVATAPLQEKLHNKGS
jgi:hypothetical protein